MRRRPTPQTAHSREVELSIENMPLDPEDMPPTPAPVDTCASEHAGARTARASVTRTTIRRDAGCFRYQRLDVFAVARDALVAGEAIARNLGTGKGPLVDEFRRALVGAYLGFAEGAVAIGVAGARRLRQARGDASKAAAALEALVALGLVDARQAQPVITLLARVSAMLLRLAARADEQPR